LEPGDADTLDVADVEIPNLGKLECRPVLPETQVVHIPPEVWSDRLAMWLLEDHRFSATLLGFTKQSRQMSYPSAS